MTDFLKIAKSIVVHFAHICAYGVETVKKNKYILWFFKILFRANLFLMTLKEVKFFIHFCITQHNIPCSHP